MLAVSISWCAGRQSVPATRTRHSTASWGGDRRRLIFGSRRRRVRHRGHAAFASIRAAWPANSFPASSRETAASPVSGSRRRAPARRH
uniref:Uncharacterized protein n=1 Tax=Triticum urartu TaxID=4572 RepID=A0A8R7PYR5_TRIUA